MEELIAWCGFAGAWLLFGGPIYQAALELQEQDIERDRMAELGEPSAAPAPAASSPPADPASQSLPAPSSAVGQDRPQRPA